MSEVTFIEGIKEKCPEVFEKALAENYIVCVPMNVEEKQITPRFISNSYTVDHLIIPSLHRENIFHTMTGKTLLIKNNEIKPHLGYNNDFTVQKLRETNSHDSTGRVYKQVLVSGNLEDSPEKDCTLPAEPILKFHSAKEYIGFLQVVIEKNQAAVMYSKAFTFHFNNNYLILPGFSQDCYKKVRAALTDLKAILLKIPELALAEDSPSHLSYLCELTESSIIHPIYGRLFPHIIEFSEPAQSEFSKSAAELLRLQHSEKWGFEPCLESCRFTQSLLVLRGLVGKMTPWEKLDILIDLAGSIEQEAKAHLLAVNSPRFRNWEMSADQYFPLLMYFFCISDPPQLLATLSFVSELSVNDRSAGNRRYQLINAFAAVSSVRNMLEDLQGQKATEEQLEGNNRHFLSKQTDLNT